MLRPSNCDFSIRIEKDLLLKAFVLKQDTVMADVTCIELFTRESLLPSRKRHLNVDTNYPAPQGNGLV